jgi:hypothetical protein
MVLDFIHNYALANYPRQRPTACVTRAGAGGGTPSDWKNAEA